MGVDGNRSESGTEAAPDGGSTADDASARDRSGTADGTASGREAPSPGAACSPDEEPADRPDRERALERYRAVVEALDDGVYVLDADHRFRLVNDALCSLTGYDRETLLGSSTALLVDEDDLVDVHRHHQALTDDDRVAATVAVTLETTDGQRVPVETRFVRFPVDGGHGRAGVVRDVTERRTRERQLERRRSELEVLDRVNERFQAVSRVVAGAADRCELEAGVVETLAAADRYAGAWIGRWDPGCEALAVVARGGEMPERAVADVGDDVEPGDGPLAETLETLEVRVVDDADGRCPAADVVVPVRYDGTVLGVLVVHSPDGADPPAREVAMFDALGSTIGHAVNALDRKRALVADRVEEVTLRLSDPDHFFCSLSAETTAVLRSEGTTSADDTTHLDYVSVEGVDAAAVVDRAAASRAVDRVRQVCEHDGVSLFEFRFDGPSIVATLAERGATLARLSGADGIATAVAHVPPPVDVRTVVEGLDAAFDEVELVGRRSIDRPVHTLPEFRAALDERFTGRQRKVLEAAYYAGYFDWPRASTAEELADAMGIASPTLHRHLRKALGGLLDSYFDDPAAAPRELRSVRTLGG